MKKVYIIIATFTISINCIFSSQTPDKKILDELKFVTYFRNTGIGLLTTGIFFTLGSFVGFGYYSYIEKEIKISNLNEDRIEYTKIMQSLVFEKTSIFNEHIILKNLSTGISIALISAGSVLNISAIVLFILSSYYEKKIRENSSFKNEWLIPDSKKYLIYGLTFLINGGYSITGGISGYIIGKYLNDQFKKKQTLFMPDNNYGYDDSGYTEYIIISSAYLSIGIVLELIGIIFMGLSNVKKYQEKFDLSIGFNTDNKDETGLNISCAFKI